MMNLPSQLESFRFQLISGPRNLWLSRSFLILFVVFAGLLGTGCNAAKAARPLTAEAAKSFQPLKVNSIAIMPLEGGVGTRLSKETQANLDKLLLDAFEVGTSLEILNTKEATRAKEAISQVSQEAGTPVGKAAELGRALGAQGALFGVVNQYEESDGSRYGASRASAVSFKLWLLDLSTNQVVWQATYQNREQSLTENLFRVGQALKDGVGFKSSIQLAENGFRDAAEALEAVRAAAPR